MNRQQAFEFLLESVEAALQESLARSNAATRQGDFDAVEVELERQRNLVSARNQLQGLRELWPRLVGERQPAQRLTEGKPRVAKRQRLPRGVRTPEEAFVVPILTVLEELGGSASMSTVLDRLETMMAARLNEHDRSPLKRGRIRWRNTAQWARQDMKEDGLLASDSPYGIWEITEVGRAFLRQHREELP
jgi:restriction system protein